MFWALTVSNNSCKEETLKYLRLTTL